MNGTNHLDLEKINKSIETISGVEDCISNRDLSEEFTNLENYFRDINFEHGNYLSYKEDLEMILNNINQIKRKISSLADSLITTVENYDNIESLDDNDKKELNSIYSGNISNDKLATPTANKNNFRMNLAADLYGSTTQQSNQQVIQNSNINNNNGTVTTIPQVEEPIEEYTTKSINTVPIGIAIGATGIIGSIGAVVINEKYGNKGQKTKYKKEDDEALLASSKSDVTDNYFQSDEDNFDNYESPYKASRVQREVDRYYGNDITLEDENDSNDSNSGDYYE